MERQSKGEGQNTHFQLAAYRNYFFYELEKKSDGKRDIMNFDKTNETHVDRVEYTFSFCWHKVLNK